LESNEQFGTHASGVLGGGTPEECVPA